MNEYEAVEVWRELAPLDASLRRHRPMGARDRPFFDVVVPAFALSGKDIETILKTASARSLESGVQIENGQAVMVIFGVTG